jgi:hypothetical protein
MDIILRFVFLHTVPAHGKVCLWSDEQVERESTFTYASVERSSNSVGKPQTVTVVSYNVQTCPTIPDFGPSGFVTPPASPAVAIQFDGLQIKFEVTVTYVRNQTAWRKLPSLLALPVCRTVPYGG